MKNELRIEGIYDKRTIQLLQEQRINDFGFDFCPRSFNFIQEHVFLKEIIPLLSRNQKIYLKFPNSNDLMLKRIVKDLNQENVNQDNIFFEFSDIVNQEDLDKFEYQFLINYSQNLNISKIQSKLLKGIIFDFTFLESLNSKNLLNSFVRNFYSQNTTVLNENIQLILKADWPSNLLQSLFHLMDFNLLSLPINSNIEICYRNVDINKLKQEIRLISKNLIV